MRIRTRSGTRNASRTGGAGGVTVAVGERDQELVVTLVPRGRPTQGTGPGARPKIEDLPDDHDPGDLMQAMAQAFRDDVIPVGVLYNQVRPTLQSHTRVTNHPLKPGSYDFDVRSLLEIYR